MPRVIVGLAVALGIGAAAPCWAKKPERATEPLSAEHAAAVVFDQVERRLIYDFFAEPGRREAVAAKPLPPGIAKKVARGGRLPPGIAKRYLPGELDGRLRPRPAGFQKIIVGDDVLLVEAATGLVYDIVKHALAGR
jgi:hypothetical protein